MAVMVSGGSSLPGFDARSRRRVDRAAWAATVCVLLGGAFRLVLVLTGMPPTSSDEATMALAALHIAEGRHFPAYFYGQHYMGTLEAFLAAPVFAVAGPSLVALRLPLVPMYLLFGWLMYQLTRRLYTRWFAVAVVALLALGSHSVVQGQVFAGGGYPEIRPLGAGVLLLALLLASGCRWRLAAFAGFGLLAGLAVWDDWLILPYVAAAGLLLAAGCGRELLGRSGAVLLAGVLVGAAPAVVHHVALGVTGTSLSAMLHLAEGEPAPLADRLYGAVLLGVPLGGGLCAPGSCEGWPLLLGALYPFALLAAGGGAAVALRRAAARPERIRQMGRLALAVAAAVTLVAYARSGAAGHTPGASVRYLTPLLISLPAVLWPLWTAAARLRRQSLGLLWIVPGRAVAATLLLVTIVAGMLLPTVALARDLPRGAAEAARERALVTSLERSGVTHLYTVYWTCNRLAFASRERLVCAVLENDLRPGLDRYRPYRDAVAVHPNPAYVFPIGSPADRAFAARLAATGVPARIEEVGGYRVYHPAWRPM
ncbi:hypothetical protein ACTMTJ_12305 [Phytohabitans sp. LJ34]|uniref:hypothetical protein n=1 Tax=Phytohabitans sp. LJ34 TaxID=3452217 RepID=UPI003F88B740